MKLFRLTIAVTSLLLAAGCSTPVGDYFDRWFGSGPALKPAELVPRRTLPFDGE